MGPYHAILVHFPVAFWTVAAGAIVFRALSDRPLARAFDRIIVATLLIGAVSGLVAYLLGQLVWSPATLQATPLGRNHMLGATWSLFYWIAVLGLRWRGGESVWASRPRRVVMLILGASGAVLVAVTGTIGGHLHGAPAYLGEVLRMLGLDLYQTYYVPDWVLVVMVVVSLAMPAVAIAATRNRRLQVRVPEAVS
jgi:uncharacterized membrane protein